MAAALAGWISSCGGGGNSPWAAEHLERLARPENPPIKALWNYDQAALVRHFAGASQTVLWGCDMDESQPQRLILDVAQFNPKDTNLQQMVKISSNGYSRKQAPELLRIAEADHPGHDVMAGGISLWQSIRDTLRIEHFALIRTQSSQPLKRASSS